MDAKTPKLLDHVREILRINHYAYRTEQSYVPQNWSLNSCMGVALCVSECLRLRIKDLDFANHQIIVRDGKGENDRATVLPDALISELKSRIELVRLIRQKDLKEGFAVVSLPYALEKKYPNAPINWEIC